MLREQFCCLSSLLSRERNYCLFTAAFSSLRPSLCRLCVAALSVNSFCGSREALYGVFDGDRNVEVPYLLQCTMNDVLAEEIHKTKSEEDYMTNTFLVMQRYATASISLLSQIIFIPLLNGFFFFFYHSRKLGTAGQKLGGSAALCHIRHDPTDPGGCFTLTAANVGKCQAILCRDGKPLPMSLLHNIGLEEEYRRIRQHRAIITEVKHLENSQSTLIFPQRLSQG